MAKKKSAVIKSVAQAEVPVVDDSPVVAIEPTSALLLGAFDLGSALAEVEAQATAARTRQQAILAQLAAATGMDLADLLFLFGLSTNEAVVVAE